MSDETTEQQHEDLDESRESEGTEVPTQADDLEEPEEFDAAEESEDADEDADEDDDEDDEDDDEDASDLSDDDEDEGDESDDASDLSADDEDDEDQAILEREGDIAADYLEELLDIADLDGDLDMDVEGDRASVSIVGADLSLLVGRNGEVLDALQELTRLAVLRETGERSRLMLDIGGHRADQRTRLERLAAETVAEVKASGEPVALDPMTPFERKVVHDSVAAAGLLSSSDGVEPRRYVVVRPV